MLYLIAALAILIADQALKYYVTLNIPLGEGVVAFIPHVMSLVHYRNTGAAFSMLGTNCIYNFEEYSDGYVIDGEETNESMLLTFGIPAERNKHLDLAYVAWNLAGAFALGAVVRFFYKRTKQ